MEEKYQRKLQILMKNEGVSQSRLAEMLEVKPSTLSHILAGRNYPGFDMLQKLRRLFPHINADWLLLDTSEDYLAGTPTASAASDLFSNGNAPDDAATAAARGALGNTSRSSATAAGRTAATAPGRGGAAAGSAADRVAGAVGAAGYTRTAGNTRPGDMRTSGSAAGGVRDARTVGSVAGAAGRTGAVGGGDAQGVAAASSLFDASSSNVSSGGTDAASSAVSAQMLASFDRADGVRIRRIIVLYEDNSFESFTPRP